MESNEASLPRSAFVLSNRPEARIENMELYHSNHNLPLNVLPAGSKPDISYGTTTNQAENTREAAIVNCVEGVLKARHDQKKKGTACHLLGLISTN